MTNKNIIWYLFTVRKGERGREREREREGEKEREGERERERERKRENERDEIREGINQYAMQRNGKQITSP